MIPGSSAKVKPILDRINQRTNERSDRNGKLNHASLECAKAVALTEGLHHGREEEEQDTPSEADPKREEDDHGLGEEHLRWSHERYLKQMHYALLLKFGFRVDWATGLFTEFLGAFFQDDIASGLFEDEPEYWD